MIGPGEGAGCEGWNRNVGHFCEPARPQVVASSLPSKEICATYPSSIRWWVLRDLLGSEWGMSTA